jgi:hypothetical protein
LSEGVQHRTNRYLKQPTGWALGRPNPRYKPNFLGASLTETAYGT